MKAKSTMRQRAREIIEEDLKYQQDKEVFLREKIKNCDETVHILYREGSADSCDLCPFPKSRRWFGDIRLCQSCGYFFKNISISKCGCFLIEDKVLTINQAIVGLRIFKNVMKKYLAELEEQSHASKNARR